jgi:flavin reductase (DIM6/NTAB) family NADH-FMN oxidoreductase RutF
MNNSPVAVDSESFRRACSKFATGITIATVLDGDGTPHGMTANSFTSVSCGPPLVLLCIDHRTSILPSFRSSIHFGINILGEEQREISIRFARKGHDRFDGVPWVAGRTGVPLLDDALACFECRITERVAAGDHDIFIGEVISTMIRDGRPLVFFDSGYGSLA